MADENNGYDWRERMRRLEDSIDKNWDEHERMDRNLKALRDSMVQQKENVDQLLLALSALIDRIPPESLRA